MSAPLAELHRLLALSLDLWATPGRAHLRPDGAIYITCGVTMLTVEPAAPGLPIRWMVTIGDRTRAATSVHGVLRQVRAALDRNYQPSRIRIAPDLPATS